MAELLRAAGHDCSHVYELGLGGQPDEHIMARADHDDRILISADTDFGELLANAPVLAPSVILLRRADKRAGPLASVLLANLEQVTDDETCEVPLTWSNWVELRGFEPLTPSMRIQLGAFGGFDSNR
jgi:predicted nuclease of predicted toxin-antitoxin system